jgi:hypothetical protein
MSTAQVLGDLYQVPTQPAKKYGKGMPAIKRTLPAIPTSVFRFRDNVFYARFADLRPYTFGTYIRLQSQRTDKIVDFDCVEVERDRRDEAAVLIFRGVGSSSTLQIRISCAPRGVPPTEADKTQARKWARDADDALDQEIDWEAL